MLKISKKWYRFTRIYWALKLIRTEVGVPTKEDVDREYERLTALGVQSLTGEPVTQPWGQRNFWIADPEGNYIEIGC